MSELSKNLANVARYWAGEITKLAKAGAPNHLQSKIKTSRQEISPGVFSITTTVVADDAAAQEYGSGERVRDRRRKRERYPIRPKPGKKYLAFHWEVANQNPDKFTFLDDGRVILPQVMHPGIHPYNGVGYVGPAFRAIRKRAKKDLDPAVYKAIFGDLNRAFKSAGKK